MHTRVRAALPPDRRHRHGVEAERPTSTSPTPPTLAYSRRRRPPEGLATHKTNGLSYPTGVAVDAAGDVFIANWNPDEVIEEPAGGGAQVVVASGLNQPSGLAVDAAGDVYIADSSNNRVLKVPAGGGTPSTVGTGLSYPTGVAVDAAVTSTSLTAVTTESSRCRPTAASRRPSAPG